MRLLNLGCGSHYVVSPDWTNVDFNSNDLHVISHDLSQGIPFKDNTFDMIYHSHVLEHFSKSDGVKFVNECFRVLKPGGILRVAIPDLEQITRNYLKFLELGLKDPHDPLIEANYDWMLLEMYDQTVRNISGGEMLKYLHQENLINEEFIYE
ncbi:MAG: methyltransferase domain-containing protein, partial [Ginsengibacter sp.]